MISIIVAMSENRVIGRDGDLPWRLPEDLRRFKTLTTDHTLIMGRKTWETLPPGGLSNRRCIVLTRDPEFAAEGAEIARSLEGAIDLADDDDEIFIAGGAAVYEAALPRADRVYLTIAHAEIEGDTFFPEFDTSGWTLIEEDHRESDERHAYAMTFLTYDTADSTADS